MSHRVTLTIFLATNLDDNESIRIISARCKLSHSSKNMGISVDRDIARCFIMFELLVTLAKMTKLFVAVNSITFYSP